MRIFTIFLSILLGVVLCLIFLNNPQYVPFIFTKMDAGRGVPSQHALPLWQIVFGSVAVGACLGYLLGVTGGRPSARSSQPTPQSRAPEREEEDVDYVLGIRSDKRR